ncbi:MAG TPA: PAS domain S-box protein [Streptosporangiaceae bacterium]|nr:PAS domain S-box protein [Streptosporangiaceae bacterium]
MRLEPSAASPHEAAGEGRPASFGTAADERYRALLESAPDAMVIVDDAGIIRLVNAQTELMFGYSRDELLGRPVEFLVPERLRSHHLWNRRRYTETPQVRPMGAGLDLSGLRGDGTEFPVEISLSPLETSDGMLVSAAVRDVSDRKAAEQRINQLALIVESSQDAILTTTLDGVITFWNLAAAGMYGYPVRHAIGRHVSALVPPGQRGEIDTILERIARGEQIDHYEGLRMTRTGGLLDVDIVLWPVRTHSGAIEGACAIVRDITEHTRARQELTRLYEQQREVALTLQRSLMGTPRTIPGIQTASRYLPATQGPGVGGDWFDLIPLGAGRVGVLIGDVMGRGLEAATVMGRLHSAANALARTGMPPRQLMHAVDAVVGDMPDQLITCSYVVLEVNPAEVTVTSAGHLPVLLVEPDATVRELPVPVSVPLGVGLIPHQETRLAVPPGSTLVFYTDGLVETPASDIGTQIEALEAALHAIFLSTSSLEAAADGVLSALLPGAGEPTDDVTLLLVRTPAAPLASARTSLRPEATQVAAGRRFVRDALTAWGLEALADVACLLASEILTNAVGHTGVAIDLDLYHTARELVIEVADDNARRPQLTRPGPADESGRGLTLVDALAGAWGVRPSGTGKIVWFTLPIPAADDDG